MRHANSKKGRPPKFDQPRRPITVTLPESTLAQLAAIDADRAQAIVKVTNAAMPSDQKRQKPVELVEVMPGRSIILVGPSRHLRKVNWLRLVEVAPQRFLLTIPSGTAVDSLELAVVDLIQNLKREDRREKSMLEELRNLMRQVRLEGNLSKAELLFIDTNVKKGAKRRAPSLREGISPGSGASQ